MATILKSIFYLNELLSIYISNLSLSFTQDQNDNPPYFEPPNGQYEATIAENFPYDTTVITVAAKDDDGTVPNNELLDRIESGAKDKFRIDAVSGSISLEPGASLDWNEYGKEYTLTVVAADRGTPSLSGDTTVIIRITDVNNKDPVFSPDRRYGSLYK